MSALPDIATSVLYIGRVHDFSAPPRLDLPLPHLPGHRSGGSPGRADAFAVRALGDPELVIRTLIKLHTLNESPHRMKPLDEAVASHPSLVNRLAAIRARTAS